MGQAQDRLLCLLLSALCLISSFSKRCGRLTPGKGPCRGRMSAFFCMVFCVSGIQQHPFFAPGILQTHASPPPFQGFLLPLNHLAPMHGWGWPSITSCECVALRGECCRLTATLANTAALPRLDLCKDCRDLFLYINYISFYYGANHYLTKTCLHV